MALLDAREWARLHAGGTFRVPQRGAVARALRVGNEVRVVDAGQPFWVVVTGVGAPCAGMVASSDPSSAFAVGDDVAFEPKHVIAFIERSPAERRRVADPIGRAFLRARLMRRSGGAARTGLSAADLDAFRYSSAA